MESPDAVPWPGNVRELSNLIERLLILYPQPDRRCGGSARPLSPAALRATDERLTEMDERDAWLPCSSPHQSWIWHRQPRPRSCPGGGVNLKEMLADLEVELIRQALESQDGVVARAADLLSMRRTTLVRR